MPLYLDIAFVTSLTPEPTACNCARRTQSVLFSIHNPMLIQRAAYPVLRWRPGPSYSTNHRNDSPYRAIRFVIVRRDVVQVAGDRGDCMMRYVPANFSLSGFFMSILRLACVTDLHPVYPNPATVALIYRVDILSLAPYASRHYSDTTHPYITIPSPALCPA